MPGNLCTVWLVTTTHSWESGGGQGGGINTTGYVALWDKYEKACVHATILQRARTKPYDDDGFSFKARRAFIDSDTGKVTLILDWEESNYPLSTEVPPEMREEIDALIEKNHRITEALKEPIRDKTVQIFAEASPETKRRIRAALL